MRRLVIELSPPPEMSESGGQGTAGPEAELLSVVKSLEMVHILRMGPGELAAIVRIEKRDPQFNIERIFALGRRQGTKLDAELLDKESDTISTYFIRAKMNLATRPGPMGRGEMMPYLSPPFEFKDGKMRITLLGSSSQIRRYLASLSKQTRVKYRVASLADARFPPNSPLVRLTEKQRKVLTTAYKLGYYDVPRRITSAELANRLSMVKSTLSAHVRKAERRLLSEMLREL